MTHKLKKFAQQFQPDDQFQDSIVTLQQLGHTVTNSIDNPESVLHDILTRCVTDGTKFARNSKHKKTE